jgi:hypothetical protein
VPVDADAGGSGCDTRAVVSFLHAADVITATYFKRLR